MTNMRLSLRSNGPGGLVAYNAGLCQQRLGHFGEAAYWWATSSQFSTPHELAIKKSKLASFEFYCWRHTFGTRMAESGVDKFALARLMGHSSPSVAERYYVHVTEPHGTAGFEKFENYQKAMTLLAKKKIESFPQQSDKVQ